MHREPKPPAGASRLMSWLRDPHLPQILGDLDEEFGTRVRSLGAAAAHRWYWRESIRNAWFLLWRKPAVIVPLAAILAVTLVNTLLAVMADVAWRVWIKQVAWPTHYRPSFYRQTWGMGWPGGFGFAIVCAPIAGFAVGYLFALAMPERVKQVRLVAMALWAGMMAWYTVWLFGFLNLSPLIHLPAGWLVYARERLLIEFCMREGIAAGAFFVAAGLARTREHRAQTE